MTFAELQAEVASLIQDAAATLVTGDRDARIRQAILQRYSKDRPWEVTNDIAGNGTQYLGVPVISAGTYNGAVFEDGWSVIRQIEFPIGQWPPALLDTSHDYALVRTPTGPKIYLDTCTPGVGDLLRITWTSRHLAAATSIQQFDFNAVADLAASLCCDALAQIYAQTRDVSLQADSVNYRTKSQEYLALAKNLRKRYCDHMGIADSVAGQAANKPAMALGDMDETMQIGVDRLIHKRGTR
jgi:hypothetical protein